QIFFLFAGLFIISIALFVSFKISKNQHPKYNIGDNIQFSGIISPDNNYPVNTHKISNEKQDIGIKSSTINLNNFLDQNLNIFGTIDSIGGEYPVVKINTIKNPKSKLIINDNKYFFTDKLISFNFSEDTNITAKKVGKYIKIYYQDKEMLEIESFICNKVTPTQDCDKMQFEYIKRLNDVFTSFLGHMFYKNPDGSRVTFNGNTLGYILKPTNEEFLLDISHLINIINPKFIAEFKNEIISNNCVEGSGSKVKSINNIKIDIIDENLIKLDTTIINQENTTKKCKLTIDVRNDRDVKTITIN
ncbi:MAG TPA: hypothetical protein P5060_03190, partial [Candidatus Absconditabacterales bacterium]|nr:hypothetical protein [Candidatus Absconditabacterales bacterium]